MGEILLISTIINQLWFCYVFTEHRRIKPYTIALVVALFTFAVPLPSSIDSLVLAWLVFNVKCFILSTRQIIKEIRRKTA